jgi:hypothetical protein
MVGEAAWWFLNLHLEQGGYLRISVNFGLWSSYLIDKYVVHVDFHVGITTSTTAFSLVVHRIYPCLKMIEQL